MFSKSLRRGLATLAVLAAGVTASNAFAGECPADKVQAGATGPGATAPTAVTDVVLAQIDLGDEAVALDEQLFRLRRLEILPGGEVPWHSHDERPALIYVVEGEILEFNSNCAVPIVHKAGEVAPETHGTAHWWKNNTNRTVVLLSADILRDQSDKNM